MFFLGEKGFVGPENENEKINADNIFQRQTTLNCMHFLGYKY